MDSTSNSDEGEILEVELKDLEKAPLSKPSVHDSSVDRHSSTRLSSDHPPPPSRHDDVYVPDDYYSDGSKKRRRDDDTARDDPRRHRVHYEGPYGRGGGEHRQSDAAAWRPKISYADIDDSKGAEKPGRSMSPNGNNNYPESKRTRTESRSPPPHPTKSAYPASSRESRRGYSRDDRDRNDSERRRRGGFKHQSVSERARRGDAFPRQDAESRRHKVLQSGQNYDSPAEGGQDVGSHGRDNGKSNRQHSPSTGRSQTSDIQTEPPFSNPVDDEKALDERRRRREAIKAKYRGQATPLLVSALQLNSSTPGTPGSPAPDTPADSLMNTATNSAPDSPAEFTIEKSQHDPAPFNGYEGNKNDGDLEPSAADYDPTKDMEDDRMRHDKRHIDVFSSAYDEVKTPNPHDILMPEEVAAVSHQNGVAENDFDMFAEGDDDDMFGPTSPSASKAVNPIEAAKQAVAQAKQLDVGMLDNWDDGEGYYRIILGELIDGRYHVNANLGKGMFSGVVRALDTETQNQVAIKFIRNNETMRKAGQKEIDILQRLNSHDPEDKKHIVRLVRYFDHKGHLCLVFENLSLNLREVLKKFGRDVGINIRAVRAYAQQMFLGLSLLRKSNILHADIKPDNILVNEGRNVLKICDLGSASEAAENEITPYLVSRFYRAPEIILGMSYDYAIDMWSVGCTLYELYTGKILFTGRTNNQMLRSIMETQGKFSQKMLKKAQFSPMHFDDMLNFRSVEPDKMTGKDVVKLLNFAKPPRDLKARLLATASGMSGEEIKDLNLFIDLLDRCLALNPERRITPLEALKHPFIQRR